jgi:hypothetical protein
MTEFGILLTREVICSEKIIFGMIIIVNKIIFLRTDWLNFCNTNIFTIKTIGMIKVCTLGSSLPKKIDIIIISDNGNANSIHGYLLINSYDRAE